MTIQQIDPSGIYATYFTRGDGTWHGALYVANPAVRPFGMDGFKVHATNSHGGAWMFEAARFSLITSKTLSVALRIGTLHSGMNGPGLVNLLSQLPMAPSPEDAGRPFDCMTWLRAAIIAMNRMNIIRCPNVNYLERELVQMANQADLLILG